MDSARYAVRLRPPVFQQVRHNDSIVQCESCQRVLYWVPPPPPVSLPSFTPRDRSICSLRYARGHPERWSSRACRGMSESRVSQKLVTIYTDGACTGNPGPAGTARSSSAAHRRELSGGFRRTTNNRMELMAVIKALEALKTLSGDTRQ